MKKENYLIDIIDLPEDEWIYLNKEGVIRRLLESVIFTYHPTIRGSYKKIRELTNFSKWFINKLHRKSRKKIKIAHFKLLVSLLPKSKQERFLHIFRRHISKIGTRNSILNPKIPISFNSIEGAKILGDLLTDCSLNSNFQVTYSNSNLTRIFNNLQTIHKLLVGEELSLLKENNFSALHLGKLLRKLEGKGRVKFTFVRQVKKNKSGPNICYQLTFTNILGKILNKNLKIPKGRRVYTNPQVPDFILSSDELSGAFIGRIFSNEGHVETFGATVCHSIDLTDVIKKSKLKNKEEIKNFLEENRQFVSPKLLWGYRKILLYLECKKPSEPFATRQYLTKSGEFRVKWTIYVGGRDIVTLLNKVEFDKDFENPLRKYTNSVRFFKIEKQSQVERILPIAKQLQSDLGCFTPKMIANTLNLNITTVYKHINMIRRDATITPVNKIGKTTFYKVS